MQVPGFPKAKKPGRYQEYAPAVLSDFPIPPRARAEVENPPYAPMKRNYGAEVMTLNVWRFAGSGV